MDRVIKVPVQPLEQEAFRPYGTVLGPGSVVTADVDDGLVEVRVNSRRNHTDRVKYISFHNSYDQTYIPMRGSIAFIVAPRPVNDDAPQDEWIIDFEGIRAFVLEAGQGLHIKKGIGHINVPITEECLLATVTRRHGVDINSTMAFIEGRGDSLKNVNKIEYVNLQERHGILLELNLDSVLAGKG